MAGEVGAYSAGRFRSVEWSELERVLLQRPGWRRIGSELKGPCPLCGGRDRCWARPGDTASVLLTCRVCEAPFGELLAAVSDFNIPERQPDTYKQPLAQSRQLLDHLVALWGAGDASRERDSRGALPRTANRVHDAAAVGPMVPGGPLGHGARVYVRFPPARPGRFCTASRRHRIWPGRSWRCRSRRSTGMPTPSGSTRLPTRTNLASDRTSADR